ncbi:acyltransferase, partial [Mesorhizobium sp. M7A.T.Ca.TU.009.01.3.2]
MNTRSAEQNYIATLDLLRLAAALAVVFFHYFFRGAAAEGYLAQGYPLAAPFALYGYLGVNLFFLISGFVIAW